MNSHKRLRQLIWNQRNSGNKQKHLIIDRRCRRRRRFSLERVTWYAEIKEPSATGRRKDGLFHWWGSIQGRSSRRDQSGHTVERGWNKGRNDATTFTSPLATLFRTTVRDEWYNQRSRATPQHGRATETITEGETDGERTATDREIPSPGLSCLRYHRNRDRGEREKVT